MDVLNRIYKTRKQKGITQKEICKAIGIAESAFDNWKKKKNESYKKYLPEIARILGVTVDYLLTGTENAENELLQKYNNAPEFIRKAIDTLLNGYGE